MSDALYNALLTGGPIPWDEKLRVVSPAAWKQIVVGRDGCSFHEQPSDCYGPIQAHHVITQQHLRKRGLSAHAWDVRNGMGLCEQAHRRHTLAVERIPYGLLHDRAHEFAAEHGLGWMLDRYYPKQEAA